MIENIIKTINQNKYNITVIDHTGKTMSKLSLDDAIKKFNCQLNKFDSVVMTEATHDTLSSFKQFKPAKSTVVVTKLASTLSSNRCINYSDYSSLSCKFANPDICAVFLDKIEITVPLSRKEAKQLENGLFCSEKSNPRIKYRKHRNADAVKYKESFTVEYKCFGSLMLLIKPISGRINRLKIVFNPSSYREKDLTVLVKKLMKICQKNFEKRVLNSNITRLDFTFDSDGFFVKDAIFSLQKGQYFKLYISPDSAIESKVAGAKRSTRAQFYDKSVEQVKRNDEKRAPTAVNTRFEVSIRPHNIKKVKKVKFKHLDQVLPLFPNLTVYDVNELKHKLGKNSADWQIVEYFGISALRRTKNNTERTKLSKLLEDCKIEIDGPAFDREIQKLLEGLLRTLLGTNHR